MRLIRYTLLVLLTGLFSGLQAQDIHWSLYQMSPLTLNPALTGAYEGTARIGGIYRDQARSIIGSNAFSTPSIYGDAPLFNVGKTDWVGVGGLLISDRAGEGQSQNTSALASIAYHKSLDKKRNTILTFGLQGGIAQRRMDLNSTSVANPNGGFTNTGLWFGEEVRQSLQSGNARVIDPMSRNGIEDNSSYFDLNAGVLLTTRMNKQTDLNIGASFYHILRPKYAFIGGNDMPSATQDPDSVTVRLPMRFQLHGQFNFDMSKKWTLSPGFLYNRISSASELQVQALLGYNINPANETTLRFGPGYRLSDAFQVLLGIDMKNLRVMASYDVTLSSLSDANSSVGGFEIAAYYIIKIFKEPVVKPVIFCPRF